MSVNPLEDVEVSWDGNLVEKLFYKALPLSQAINPNYNAFDDIDHLLDVVSSFSGERKVNLATKVFESIAIFFSRFDAKERSQLWIGIMKKVWLWESSHEVVHKGTPYYLMGETYLALGDVSSAYISFFNAIEEDKRSYKIIRKRRKLAPAYLVTSLVDNKENALHKPVVVPLRKKLASYVRTYNIKTGENLSLNILDRRFLKSVKLDIEKRFFVPTFHEIYNIDPLHLSKMIENEYSRLKIFNIWFNLSLIIDMVLQKKLLPRAAVTTTNRTQPSMSMGVYRLAILSGWATGRDSMNLDLLRGLSGGFVGKLRPTVYRKSLEMFLPGYLDGTCTYDNRPMGYKMQAIIVAYRLRNFGAHNLGGTSIISKRYYEVLELLIHALFVAISF